jgi:hypothetical protein
MPAEPASDLKFEIGHVLFIDIVGYSKLLIDEQRERIQELRQIARGTEQFRLAEADGKLMRLPTGDGGALVFRTSPEAPVLCALEIRKALKTHPELRVRMGIHSGPVNEVADLNEQVNMALTHGCAVTASGDSFGKKVATAMKNKIAARTLNRVTATAESPPPQQTFAERLKRVVEKKSGAKRHKEYVQRERERYQQPRKRTKGE